MKTISAQPGVIEAHLAKLDLFQALAPADLSALAQTASLRLYDSGERLFRAGQPASTLYCVVHGAVRVHRPGPGGRSKVLHLLTAPTMVAQVPVFTGGTFPANATCNEPCTVLLLPRAELVELLSRDQELSLHLLGSAMGRLQELTVSLARHGERGAMSRLAAYLMGAGEGGLRVELPGAKKDVANYLGLSPEAFSRSMATLKKGGAITEQDDVIRILDRAALEALLRES